MKERSIFIDGVAATSMEDPDVPEYPRGLSGLHFPCPQPSSQSQRYGRTAAASSRIRRATLPQQTARPPGKKMKYTTDSSIDFSKMASRSLHRTITIQDDCISTPPFRRGGASCALPPGGADLGAAAPFATDGSIDGDPLTLEEMIDVGIDPDDLAEPSEDSDEEYYHEADSYKALINVVKDMQAEGIPVHLPTNPGDQELHQDPLHGYRNPPPSQAGTGREMILYHVFDHEEDGGLPVRDAAKKMGCEYRRFGADSEDEGLDHNTWLRFKLDFKKETALGKNVSVIVTPPSEPFQNSAYRSFTGPDRYGYKSLTGNIKEGVKK